MTKLIYTIEFDLDEDEEFSYELASSFKSHCDQMLDNSLYDTPYENFQILKSQLDVDHE